MEEIEKQKSKESDQSESAGININSNEELTDENNNIIDNCVFLSNVAFQFIDNYSRSDPSVQRGGFLIGNYSGDKNNYRVWVEFALEANYTETDKSGIKFSHRTWEDLMEQMDNKYPDYRVIGWFHSQPDSGTFISKEDLFIHKMFFDSFWQVSYVIDNLSREHAFYGWDKDNEISPVSFKMEGEPLYIALKKEKQKKVRGTIKKNNSALWDIAKIGVPLIGALLFFYGFNNFYLLPSLNETISELEASVVTREEIIVSLESDIEQLITESKEPEELIELQEPEEPEIIQETPEPQEQPEPPVVSEESPLRTYTIVEGDTLWRISVRFLGDGSRFREIAELNNMSSPYNMKTGTVIKIPDN